MRRTIPVLIVVASLISCATVERECKEAGWTIGGEGYNKCVSTKKFERQQAARSLHRPATAVSTNSGDIMDVGISLGKDCSTDYDCTGPMVRCHKSAPSYEVMAKGTCVRK